MTTPAIPVPASTEQPENVLRGALFALIAVPLGAIVWVVIWSFGFIASVVSLGVAVLAVWLYRKGSGGRVGGIGVLVIAGVVLVTLLVGFWLGLVVDYLNYISAQTGLGPFEVLGNDAFWPSFGLDFGALLEQNGFNLLLSLLFGALGAFGVLRGIFRAAKANDATVAPAAYTPPAAFTQPSAGPAAFPPPPAPPAGPVLNPGTTGTLNSPSEEPPAKG